MASQRLSEGALLNGRYEIREVVGRGGMGTVYCALDTRLDVVVAVKEMLERHLGEEDHEKIVRQFEREAKLLGQLHHTNLPRVTDYFVEDEHCYLIMEFVEGRTLESRLREAPGMALPIEEVLDYGVQLADVLLYLHSQTPPVVFRDMKPANIMVQEDGTIKLIDFGIARRFQEGATKDTLLYGSPGYSPPEQYGRTQTDPRADIYALGATIHHMVTGRDPSVTPFKFPAIRSYDPTLPAALDLWIAKCVEMEEGKRYQTAAEARDLLVRIRDAVRAVPAAPIRSHAGPVRPSGPRVISKRIDRAHDARLLRRITATAVVLILVVVASALVLKMTKTQTSKQPSVRTSSPPSPPPNSIPVLNPSQTTNPPVASGGSGILTINTSPPGAVVYLNDKKIGPSPQVVADLLPGKYRLRLVPPPNSGFVEAIRDVELVASQHKEVDTQLTQTPNTSTSTNSGPFVQIQRADAQQIQLANQTGAGVRISLAFRVVGAAGKEGYVSAFFYADNGKTPIRPGGSGQGMGTDDTLNVGGVFQADAQTTDFPDFALDIPTSSFPIPLEQVSYRVVVYLDRQPVYWDPDLRPLVRNVR